MNNFSINKRKWNSEEIIVITNKKLNKTSEEKVDKAINK